jgi:hypothetical protein
MKTKDQNKIPDWRDDAYGVQNRHVKIDGILLLCYFGEEDMTPCMPILDSCFEEVMRHLETFQFEQTKGPGKDKPIRP